MKTILGRGANAAKLGLGQAARVAAAVADLMNWRLGIILVFILRERFSGRPGLARAVGEEGMEPAPTDEIFATGRTWVIEDVEPFEPHFQADPSPNFFNVTRLKRLASKLIAPGS